ncbi:MAG: NAD(P)/FAD-dependent oxidoreductase [Prevotella sp.]|nr:NAD(P)/FAD-dependent oxidoreductase [Prevotella sp.]
MTTTDLIIIGAGPGGYRAAEYAAKNGLQVVIVEQDEVGGTCLNRGCIPTKTYVHATTFQEAFERQQQVVAQLRSGVEQILSAPGITLVRGTATFMDAHTVRVCSDQVAAQEYTAPHVIIATGSSARLLPLPDINDPRLVTSTELLRRTTLPKRLTIIGAGVIGMEFASIFNRFGSEVTVIEYLKECLPMLDSDIAKRLRKLLEKRGIKFQMKTAVQSLKDLDADVILMATGRKPNISEDFQQAGFEYDGRKGITVDNNFETTIKGIYAIGDVNGRQMLAHAAEMQAMRTVNHIMGKTDGIRFDIMPAAIFTEPEAACVGPSEDQLKEQGIEYVCKKAFWRANGKAQAMGETEGMLKLFVATDDRIIGCHAYGAHAADLIQECSALMCKDTTRSELHDMIHIHPTLSEILKAATE